MANSNDVRTFPTPHGRLVRPAMAVGTAVAACTMLRPLRDEQAVRCGADVVTSLFVATFVSLVVVTALAAVASRRLGNSKAVHSAMCGAVAGLVLVLAWIAIDVNGPSPAGAAFVVGHGVLTVMTIAMAWQSVADRASAIGRGSAVAAAAIGAGIGSVLGPSLAAALVTAAGPRWLVPAAAMLFFVALSSARHRRHASPASKQGTVMDGTPDARRPEPAVRRVAFLVAGWSAVSTVVYFVQVGIVGDQVSDPVARVQWFASLDLAANAVALLIQVTTSSRTAGRPRVAVALTIGPLLAAAGFAAVWVWPDVGVLAVVSVIGRAGGTALFRPARELLLATVIRPVESHTRCVIDGIVYRASDAATAASIGVMSGGAPTVGMLALFGSTAAVGLAVAGFRIGRTYDDTRTIGKNALASDVRADACRLRVDPRLPGGARCIGDRRNHATHSLDRRATARRRPRYLADFRCRLRWSRSDP